MTLTLGHYGLLVAIVGLPLGLVGLYLRALAANVRDYQRTTSQRLDGHKTHMENQEARLRAVEQGKVSHADWVRVVTSQQHSLDTTRELVREMAGKLDATLGISGSLNRVANAIERKTEAPE